MTKLKRMLDERQEMQKYLFIRGFIITNGNISHLNGKYPFYNNWNMEKIGRYQFWTHNLQKCYYIVRDSVTYFVIGHAYNPFNMMHDETEILEYIAESSFIGSLNELTGVFILGRIEGDNIRFLLDCSGMQYGCYAEIDGHIIITSHMQLIGDIFNLEMDSWVKKLISYRFYKYMMGNYLPGSLTPYDGVKRIIPNTYVDYSSGNFKVTRFYPEREIVMCRDEEDYRDIIARSAEIFNNNMILIAKKWNRPAISLTGGIDSNTTFAAANGIYEKYETFSYISMYREQVDAEAAKRISERFNVKHSVYKVPDSNDDIKDFEIYKRILTHNAGNIGPTKDNDTRKKITLMQNNICDVEVKSWISETIRAYAYKYFGRDSMPGMLSPRHYSSLYKIFLLNRPLLWETDRYFKQYIEETMLRKNLYNYDESDFFVWEMMHGGKCGLNIGTMKFCFDITIPYNNRKLLDLLLKVPLEDRISDRHHYDMKKYLNPELSEMNIRVRNLNETKFRKMLANIYFMINTHLPF